MFKILLFAIAAAFRSRRQLALENPALRHQLEVLLRTAMRPRRKTADRTLLAWISRSLGDWKQHLTIVQPATFIGWHRLGWRLYWRRKSRKRRPGRPIVEAEVRALIRRLSIENPLWGAPRIHGELLKLGYEVAAATVGKYMVRRPGPPSQSWRTFVNNHRSAIVAIDFLTVPTLRALGIEQKVISYQSPWQNGYVERVIGPIRRECLDHVVVFGERHLRRVLREYVAYYHDSRTHLGLDKDSPEPRVVQNRNVGAVVSDPIPGGMHHRYWRDAA